MFDFPEELVIRARRGDPQAVNDLSERVLVTARRIFRARGISENELDDFCQEAALRALKALSVVRVPRLFHRIVLTILDHIEVDHIRRRKRRREAELVPPEILDDKALSLSDCNRGSDVGFAISQAVEMLPARLRRLYVLWLKKGLTLEEISETLRVSVSKVRRMKSELKRRLKRHLAEE